MIEEENEKIPLCPVCLETLTTNLYYTSDNDLSHRNCFNKLNFKSPIPREVFLYYLPVNKVVNGKTNFEKKLKNNFETITSDLDGFNQDGFNRKGSERNGFNINGTNEHGFNRNEELACEEKAKQAIRENPWKIYYTSEVFRNKYEIMKECFESVTSTYQYATLHFKKQNCSSCYVFSRTRWFLFFNK